MESPGFLRNQQLICPANPLKVGFGWLRQNGWWFRIDGAQNRMFRDGKTCLLCPRTEISFR